MRIISILGVDSGEEGSLNRLKRHSCYPLIVCPGLLRNVCVLYEMHVIQSKIYVIRYDFLNLDESGGKHRGVLYHILYRVLGKHFEKCVLSGSVNKVFRV